MNYNDFLNKFVKKNKQWKFDLFKIVCRKCSSDKVEFNSNLEVGYGYYDELEKEGKIIIKCHECGNAFTLDFDDLKAPTGNIL